MNTTRGLLSELDQTESMHTRSKSTRVSPQRKISLEREDAERKYKQLTNLTKNEQCDLLRKTMLLKRRANPQWKYDSYRINSSFSVPKQECMEKYPHNNKKYNTQFLDKTLRGGTLHFPTKNTGLFPSPQDELYTKHYHPKVIEKRAFNETYELRTSLFGKTWVDEKRERVMDKYQIQTNPFHTDRSNALISTMRPSRKHRFS